MANASIIEHMLQAIDRYAARALRADQLETFLEQYAQALEGVRPAALARVADGAAGLLQGDRETGEAAALEQLRAAVRSLANESAPEIVLDLRRPAP